MTDPTTERLTTQDPSVDWKARRSNLVRRSLERIERITLALERPVGRITKLQHLNPLYHTGPITVFLLVIILITGVYLTLFYRYGFDPSYQSVASLEASVFGRVMRALHRYASGAALITALLHGWRTFFQDRFRGARWPAWVTGVFMTVFIWVIGVTGYWMIWDERVGPLNDVLISLNSRFLLDAGSGWLILLVLFLVHLLLSAVIGLFTWWHVKRLSRRKWFPPTYWMWLLGGLLLAASIVIPAGMLPQLSDTTLPGTVPIDVFYLLPLLARKPAVWVLAGLLISVVAALVPWLLRRPKLQPIVIDRDRCTGCTFCVADCPYEALRMIPREDGRHQQEAVVDTGLCVSCGVCIGSCPEMAMTLGSVPAEPLWETTMARIRARPAAPVVFVCERHALQGGTRVGEDPIVVPLTCIGMAHPGLAGEAIEAGASEVRFVGCPPEDCANREGNEWLEQRIERRRRPRLRRRFADAAIGTSWLPPNQTDRSLAGPLHRGPATGYGLVPEPRDLVRPGLFMAAVLAVQLLLTNVSLAPAASARVVLEMTHTAGHPIAQVPATGAEIVQGQDIELTMLVDEKPVLAQTSGNRAAVYRQIDLDPGTHRITLTMTDRASGQVNLIDRTVTLANGQILRFQFDDAVVGGDPEEGRKLFERASVVSGAGCVICHSVQRDRVLVGPSLFGVGTRAVSRIPGVSAEDYLRQAIVDPDAYIVNGFPAGQMLPDFARTLSRQQIDDLVAYLLTLEDS